jgi:uncharacterized delta-60 repeat protein
MRGRHSVVWILVLSIWVIAAPAWATPGSDLDTGFGPSGTGYWQRGGWAPGEAVVQPDGKILVSGGIVDAEEGIFNFVLYRLTPAGLPDTTFSGDGVRTMFFGPSLNFAQASTALVQANGRIVEVGTASGTGGEFTALVRYMPDGNVDPSFGNAGRALIAPPAGFHAGATDAALRPGGGILVVFGGVKLSGELSQRWITLALSANGEPDPTWGPAGFRITDPDPSNAGVSPDSLAVEHNGRAIVAGHLAKGGGVAVRYLSDGHLDTSFDADGRLALPQLSTMDDVVALPSGRLLFSGLVQPAGQVVQDPDGVSHTISGYLSAVIIRRLADGSPDLGFGGDGAAGFRKGSNVFFDDASDGSGGLVRQSTGELVLGASVFTRWDFACDDWTPIVSRPALARFSANGRRDTTFSGNGVALGPADLVTDVVDLVVQPSDRIVAATSVNCTSHTPAVRVMRFPAS